MLTIIVEIESSHKISFLKKVTQQVAMLETISIGGLGDVTSQYALYVQNAKNEWSEMHNCTHLPKQVEDILNMSAIEVIDAVIDCTERWDAPRNTMCVTEDIICLTIIGGNHTVYAKSCAELCENIPHWAVNFAYKVANTPITNAEKALVHYAYYFHNAMQPNNVDNENRDPVFVLMDDADIAYTEEDFPDLENVDDDLADIACNVPENIPFEDFDTQDTSPGFQFMNQAPLISEDDYLG